MTGQYCGVEHLFRQQHIRVGICRSDRSKKKIDGSNIYAFSAWTCAQNSENLWWLSRTITIAQWDSLLWTSNQKVRRGMWRPCVCVSKCENRSYIH